MTAAAIVVEGLNGASAKAEVNDWTSSKLIVMRAQRPNNQAGLFDEEPAEAFTTQATGEARSGGGQGVEVRRVGQNDERPTPTDQLMEMICAEENIEEAMRRVRSNRGSGGVDGMSVEELPRYLQQHGVAVRQQLLTGTYRPQPVRSVQIEKPGGGQRELGIPTVVDRMIQQAMLQVLQGLIDGGFHDKSYGFRPGRSAHDAVKQAQAYIAEGYEYVVDIDLEKFFDRVNHDVLMSRLARRIDDKRVLKLVRAYLESGTMQGGVSSPRREGTPQGGPLSPLLSNLLLDELDWELERRGHRFVRYADDCNIYVKSERSGQRVLQSVERFVNKRLRLRVNHAKSAVATVWQRSFLGFSFLKGRHGVLRTIAPTAKQRFRAKVRQLSKRHRGRSLTRTIAELSQYLRGWKNYFGKSETPSDLRDLDGWIRRRLRSYHWKQWKHPRGRITALRKRGIEFWDAVWLVRRAQGIWKPSRSKVMNRALPTAYFDELGLVRLAP